MKKYGEPIFGSVLEKEPVVQTICGQIRGENREGIAIFRGIPYGDSCDDEQRFLPPLPAKAWTGIKDCRKNGNYAVQVGCSISGSEGLGEYFSGGQPELFGIDDEQQNENCLVLNVLTPGIDKKKRPVLVYIHGGGFTTGSGTIVLGADKLVREEDIVLVGINHRLGVLGYLYLGKLEEETDSEKIKKELIHPKYKESGMVGMLDLILALEWIRDNIISFGGDSEQVTIMGESGGGMKVNYLMQMEKAKGLFCRAIIESSPTEIPGKSCESADQYTRKLLNKLGIEVKQWKKLLEIPAYKLVREAAEIEENALSVLPVVEEKKLYDVTEKRVRNSYICDVPVLIGASEDELSVFVNMKEMNITWENLRDKLLEKSDNWFLINDVIKEENVDDLLKIFMEINDKDDDAKHLFIKMKSLFHPLGRDAYIQAVKLSKRKEGIVYQYLVKYDSELQEEKTLNYSWHTADLPLQMRIVKNNESEQLSKIMAHSLASFVRTGNPSTDELKWEAFTEDGNKMMVFDQVTGIQKDPLEKIREFYLGDVKFYE